MQRDTSLWPPSPKSTRSPTTTTDRNSSITASSLIRRTHRRVSSPILTAETTTTTARRASVENESNNSKNNSNATTDENDLSCQDDYDNAKTFQGQRYTKRRKRKATWIQTTALTDPKMRFLASGCFLLICTSIYLWRNPTTMTTTTTIATTTSSLERVLHHPNHVQDPAYDTEQNRWSYSLKPVLLPTSRISVHDNDDEEEWSDFGGLELENLGHAREIWYDENDVHYMQEQMRQQYHAQFYNSHYHHHYHHPQHHHHHYHGHYPDAEPRPLRTFRASSGSEETCRPVAWQDDVHSTCNVFHEFDFGMSFDQGHSKYLGYVYAMFVYVSCWKSSVRRQTMGLYRFALTVWLILYFWKQFLIPIQRRLLPSRISGRKKPRISCCKISRHEPIRRPRKGCLGLVSTRSCRERCSVTSSSYCRYLRLLRTIHAE